MPLKRSLACPHCGSTSFVIEGYREFKATYDTSRRDPVVLTTGGLNSYVTYAMCAGCHRAAIDYLMDEGVFRALYELCEVRGKEAQAGK